MKSGSRKSRLDIADPYEEIDHPLDDQLEWDAPELDMDDAAPPKKRHRQPAERLRRRGDLPEEFTSGAYEGVPVDANAVASRIDDIFDVLEESGDEAEEAAAAGLENQEDFERWYEERHAKKPRREAFCNDDDVANQIRALETQLKARGPVEVGVEITVSEAAAQRHAQQLAMMYAEALALRLRLQPAIVTATQLPQFYALDHFRRHDDETDQALKLIVDDCHAILRSIMRVTSPEIGAARVSFPSLAEWSKTILAQADQTIEYWGSKFGTTLATKLQSINTTPLQQIKAILSMKPRLLSRAQRNRKHSSILGHPRHFNETPQSRAVRIAQGDEDTEIFNDADFLRELIQKQSSLTNSIEQAMRAAQESTRDYRATRNGQHRATKGRQISLEPRPKLVGFMPSVPYEETAQHRALFQSLFMS